MNFAMWRKALSVIPNVTKEEWDKLDIISKWLIATRAAVLVMTFLSAVLAGLFALHDQFTDESNCLDHPCPRFGSVSCCQQHLQ